LEDPLPWIGDVVRAERPVRVPVVLSPDEVRSVIASMDGTSRLVGQLLYGSGLRLLECLRLRGKDVDFARHQLRVRDPKGGRDRTTPLPHTVEPALKEHLARVRVTHDRDLAAGFGSVELPSALARKFANADREWIWQWVFPATSRYRMKGGGERRH